MRKAASLLCLVSCAAIWGQTGSIIDIDATKIEHPIPRTIYGTFLEPIGHSTYGGLWAQVLENPSFEDALWSAGRIRQMLTQHPELVESSNIGLPLPWQALDAAQGWRFEPRWGDAANSFRSLLIMGLPGKQTGVRQEVYLPDRVLRYVGSIYAKPVSGPREIEISIRKRNRPLDILAKQTVRPASNDWSRLEFALEIPKGMLDTREAADFVIAVSGETRMLVDQAFLFPADHVEGMNPEMIEMARALHTPVVRFGGNYTSGYHWRDGIGPIDKRQNMLNQAWGMPEYNHFGTDEFLRFCKLIGAQPQIALNLGSGTPAEAADWVRYVNRKWGGSGGLLWELGNELWGNFQIGYPTEARVADLTKEFSQAVRKADPRSRLIATGQDPDHFESWNAAQLRNAPEAMNYLSTHFVVRTADVVKADASREFIAQAALALPVGLERQLRTMKRQIDGDPKSRDRVHIAFTEWLFSGPVAQAPMYNNLGGALCAAGFLNTLMRVADFTPISDMTGLIEFGGIWQKNGRVYGVPAYWAFRMYSTADATKLVDTKVQAAQYDVDQGVRRLPSIHSVPYLDVVSALNDAGTKLTLFCVNRSLNEEMPATVRLTGFSATSARGQQLTAADLYATNDDAQPAAVVPLSLNLDVKGAEVRHTFPPRSVTVIELSR